MTQEQFDEYTQRQSKNTRQTSHVAAVTQNSVPDKQGIGVTPAKGVKGLKTPKYKNKKVTIDGILFDSAKEANRWLQLKAMQTRGEISGLQRQAVFVLVPSVVLDGRKKPAIRYLADFAYQQGGKDIVEDVKSAATKGLAAYRMKKHLMKSVHGLDICEI